MLLIFRDLLWPSYNSYFRDIPLFPKKIIVSKKDKSTYSLSSLCALTNVSTKVPSNVSVCV